MRSIRRQFGQNHGIRQTLLVWIVRACDARLAPLFGAVVQSPSGQVSIVLGSGTIPDKPLARALSRCADAMEDLLKGHAA